MTAWEINAQVITEDFGGYVDWYERCYICPECEEPVYECDWAEGELFNALCPICGFDGNE